MLRKIARAPYNIRNVDIKKDLDMPSVMDFINKVTENIFTPRQDAPRNAPCPPTISQNNSTLSIT